MNLLEQDLSRPLAHPYATSNLTLLWASTLVETCARLGLEHVVLCPGSRVSPLTVAFTQHPQFKCYSVLDERSAAFFALGIAKALGKPAAVVCTSGTAAANFYPAVIEAHYSRVPLLILTADRPPELQHCAAEQTMLQEGLYGRFPRYQMSLAAPEPQLEFFKWMRQSMIHAYQQTMSARPGPVHVNIPLRDPMAPIGGPIPADLMEALKNPNFFAHIERPARWEKTLSAEAVSDRLTLWKSVERGLIISGPYTGTDPEGHIAATIALAHELGWPVLASPMSPLRFQTDLCHNLIAGYDAILRNPELCERLCPHAVIQLGRWPTSKFLRSWLSNCGARVFSLDESEENLDSQHTESVPLAVGPQAFKAACTSEVPAHNAYMHEWRKLEKQVQASIDDSLDQASPHFEGAISRIVAESLPEGTPLFISTSTPIRDAEFFMPASDRHLMPFVNRGVNGLDGMISTALGIAEGVGRPMVQVIGDLGLLHDSNGLLIKPEFNGSLTLVLINNEGGGIFEHLPIARFNPPAERFIITEQSVNFAQLVESLGIAYEKIEELEALRSRLQYLPAKGIRVIEVCTQRKADAKTRTSILNLASEQL
ncbi:MAG TPA: 2-succinyl-5-enolpyruvyl-6-hydroxy-3-cyclohexene-1-carboxylic-acid synthase [Opitutales bacterium]|nr:2-succinyl-5-enolpyruvyl-6-hydroxy-3-cyclohexene-1-carboxylic-acid synthase [Opitutales bacterium]